MALFCTAVKRDSVPLLSFPFLRHVQVLSSEISIIIIIIIVIIIIIITTFEV